MIKRKLDVKTPLSLYDDVFGIPEIKKPREPTPTKSGGSSRSSTPTPSPRPKLNVHSNQSLISKFFRSNFTFYTFFVLTLILLLTITRDFIPVAYCDTNSNDPDCLPCPSNAICEDGKYHCKEGAREIADLCILPGTPEEDAVNRVNEIEELIASGKVSSIEDIRSLTEFQNVQSEMIELSVKLSNKYTIINGQFDEKWQSQNIQIMLYCSFAVCIIIFIVSFIMRFK
ncbi:hypothetical protein TRFO_17125 [Tritrichomonas foetus]|uniref:Man1/Src1 C-terminal domain-containing protein n=1 Tax=Tritrichomonas foetus TaxID=1144522 RepID=A0A1J4KSU5_9EUKA|nr:hypothetical protein TRFO_17125 [Tritrichomonas foetus]|eukprot:OHT12868.1 hypothetical protein TRFO_17125 [Tritrichomonas foetus]